MNQNDYQDSSPIRAVLADAADRPAAVDEFDPETESKRLIELMGQAGVLPAEQVDALLRMGLQAGPEPIMLELEDPTLYDYDDEELDGDTTHEEDQG